MFFLRDPAKFHVLLFGSPLIDRSAPLLKPQVHGPLAFVACIFRTFRLQVRNSGTEQGPNGSLSQELGYFGLNGCDTTDDMFRLVTSMSISLHGFDDSDSVDLELDRYFFTVGCSTALR